MTDFLVLDTETTGLDPKVDKVCEIGWCATTETAALFSGSCLVNPGIPISPGASAVNHLIDADVAGALTLEQVTADNFRFAWGLPVAHNAPFDSAFLPMVVGPWLDTKRMALRYLPEAEQHSNQFLRYFLKLDVPRDTPPHRAEGDAIVTAALLRYLLNGPAKADFERQPIAEFISQQAQPVLLRMVNFGKHKGKLWAEVPMDYLRWMERNPFDNDEDTNFTVRHYTHGE